MQLIYTAVCLKCCNFLCFSFW
uniref:Uncharacterized protein n=1 Tax=Anguilla anguilla TaxID=7936 RepID=A0A0E9U0V9_ANGAN